MSKVKCPLCKQGGLELLERRIWLVEFSFSRAADVKMPRECKVYRCLSCDIDIVYVAK